MRPEIGFHSVDSVDGGKSVASSSRTVFSKPMDLQDEIGFVVFNIVEGFVVRVGVVDQVEVIGGGDFINEVLE